MIARRELVEIKRKWTPPPGLDRSRPRLVSFTSAGRLVAALALGLVAAGVIAGIVLFVSAVRQEEQRARLRDAGVNTEAVITRLWRRTDGEKQRYWASVRFQAGGRVVEGQRRIGRGQWSNLREQSRVRVRYDQSNPDLYTIFNGSQPIQYWVAFVVGFGLAASGVAVAFLLARQRTLLVEGRPAPGVVTKKRGGPKQGSTVEVDYEFLLLNGAAQAGKTASRKLQVGQPISVIYDRDNRQECALPVAAGSPRSTLTRSRRHHFLPGTPVRGDQDIATREREENEFTIHGSRTRR